MNSCSHILGSEVVIIKGGTRACGSGCVLGTAPLVQSKSYFEVKIQQSGIWGIGVATRNTELDINKGGQDKESWCLCSDQRIYNDGKIIHELFNNENNSELVNEDQKCIPMEGDIIGVAFDHIDLNFYLNGRSLEVAISNVRGAIYPVLYVDDGAILDVLFTDFQYQPPPGFDRIMIEQSIL